MRKTFLILSVFVFCTCLLVCRNVLYGSPYKEPLESYAYPAVNMHVNAPMLRSPMALLFPLESFSSHEMCRRPAFTLPTYDVDNFHFTGTFFHTKPIGANFILVNENLTFRKGNSFLLLPKAFALPAYPEVRPLPTPRMNLPHPD